MEDVKIRDVTTTASDGYRQWEKADDAPEFQPATIEAESLKLRVGTLEVESGLHAMGCKVLLDGKPLTNLRSLCLRFDFADEEDGGTDGLWKVTAEIVPIAKENA